MNGDVETKIRLFSLQTFFMALSEESKSNIFQQLKMVMEKHCPPLVVNKGSQHAFEVIGNIPTPYGSKKVMVPGMYFASIVIRKDAVTFYFFPTYMNEKEFKPLAPNTWKTLKGKTCFHFKKEEQVDEKELNALFKKGIEAFKKMNWIK